VPCSARLLLAAICTASCLRRCWGRLLPRLALLGAPQLLLLLVQVAPAPLLAVAQLLADLPLHAPASLAASSSWQLHLLARPPLLRRL
jgi:hypothetical protein